MKQHLPKSQIFDLIDQIQAIDRPCRLLAIFSIKADRVGEKRLTLIG